MKILYIVSWKIPFEENNLKNIVNTQFGYYTLKSKDVDITWFTHNRKSFLYILCKWLKIPQINPIFSQLSVVGKSKQYDVIYVGFDMHLLPLAVCKLLGLIKTPIFVLSHFSYSTKYTTSRWKKVYKNFERRLVYKAFDKITFACDTLLRLAKEDFSVPERHLNVADWGANLKFYDKGIFNAPPSNQYFVAAGGMNRDYATLIEAFRKYPNANLRVYAKYRDYTNGKELPENVYFGNLFAGRSFSDAYKALREEYYNAIAVLLPIDYINDVPNGATVLVEALAMGKPIVITDADTNYIDVEKEGCGLTVKRHDVDGWVEAIRFLKENPIKAKEMGKKAYQLAKTKYNDELFADNILKQMKMMFK